MRGWFEAKEFLLPVYSQLGGMLHVVKTRLVSSQANLVVASRRSGRRIPRWRAVCGHFPQNFMRLILGLGRQF